MLQIGSDYTWLRISVEPVHKQILGVCLHLKTQEYVGC